MRFRFKAMRGDALAAKQADSYQEEIVKLHQQLAEASSGAMTARYVGSAVVAAMLIWFGFWFLRDYYVDPLTVKERSQQEALEIARKHRLELVEEIFDKLEDSYSKDGYRLAYQRCLEHVEDAADNEATKDLMGMIFDTCQKGEHERITQQTKLMQQVSNLLANFGSEQTVPPELLEPKEPLTTAATERDLSSVGRASP